MAIKIKFKRSEIVANIILNLAGLGICCIMMLNNNVSMPVKNLIVKIIVLAAIAALIANLWAHLRRYIKSLNHISALEIDHLGICNNISKPKILRWNEISYVKTKTVQMSSGRHSKILVHTYDPSRSMIINADVLDIDKNELLDLLNQKK
ncbi:hypothetical protein [Chryseobacterium camelliae]|uniref:hypothetical protein n=1 Tax=Chryseobacterium camelliae TaxID=1265445 RepID=UPI00285D0099|nr:hypothetical protein [Chryseobacterium camelliae]MDR6515820.1 hypothetical protein [Chryseobacterium camelliae]